MSISPQAIRDLEADINEHLEQDRAEMSFTFHAGIERLNDPRNGTPITLRELESLLHEFIKVHLQTVLTLNHGDTFTIRCNQSHINMPCTIEIDLRFGKQWIIQNVVTIMRKAGFISKDALILEIN
ncbi:hypothetical protein LLS47_11225 [Rouxiella badensis]|uniref:hypothetical protein n=1 Tax=Rouxiella badensis TaxID=1646377 RepID=UPI001D14CF77|nr:hypothetical protein [Rouxiella badensis]MCC3733499.1 hypothetical protein [Rouxiella badensis]MCC3757850.1 hypothetical protein [Rouxiella badensis]